MNKFLKKYWYFLATISIFSLYLFTHFWHLLELPVFADESIYIRWAQLIIDNWREYLFFPMNDGKTPLFIWMMIPFQFIFSDQLFAGRFVSVIVGLGQIAATMWAVKLFGGKRLSMIIAALIVTITPFWFFHHRMALIDATLALLLTLSLAAAVSFLNNKSKLTYIVSGVFYGLAFWTKVPALLFAPVIVLTAFLPDQKTYLERFWLLVNAGAIVIFGGLFFTTLKTQPAFSQLFSRGNDFLYPVSDVLFHGFYKNTLPNIPVYLSYFWTYLTPAVSVLILLGIFMRSRRRQIFILTLAALGFFLPIAILGKSVYPRYFLPAAIPITIGASLVLEELIRLAKDKRQALKRRVIMALVVGALVANLVTSSVSFIFPALTNSNKIPFVEPDIVQYLTEWSSGHGILETVSLIEEQARHQSVAVATEGFFGTLPDAILMYLHRRDVSNISVQGVGQPIRGISPEFIEFSRRYKSAWLVVNSHRMFMDTTELKLISQFCRPLNGPCLQVWDISSLRDKKP
ncbi:MAG: hypothetical protein COY80_00265 [Candidatus Pacebacteria bacterium CG_4_10_14_0_8_um_filter_42_14]|nr:MAG: hypothetical protein COY80_00265 [Candidatus Pacebacteria bacterium CG_4_10_14_0_8_um_filter_42_14]